jgi:DNA-binding transcriptional LysR family regulator
MTPLVHLYARRMGVQLRHLRALVAVVDEGTFTDAAIDLGVSQAAVSRAVRALEDELGVTLLRRTTRDVSLTVTGARLLGHARRVLGEITEIERIVADAPGELRIGYSWAALGRHTSLVQRRWAAEHGSALVFVQSQTRSVGLGDGTADVAVLRVPLEDPRYEVVVVGQEKRFAAVAKDDPLARRRSIAMRDFNGRTVAIDSVTGTTSPGLWSAGDGPSTLRATRTFEDWLTVIAAGQAIGMTSEATTQQHPHPGIVYRLVRDAPSVPVLLVWRKNDRPLHIAELTTLITHTYSGGDSVGTTD